MRIFSNEPSVYEAAMEYANRRIPIFPVQYSKNGSLAALCPSGPFDAFVDEGCARAVFSRNCLIAMPTGSFCGIVALHMDEGNPLPFDRSFFETSCVSTQHGTDYLYACTDFSFCGKISLGEGACFLGTGEYVLLPPSGQGNNLPVRGFPEEFMQYCRENEKKQSMEELRFQVMERSAWGCEREFFDMD